MRSRGGYRSRSLVAAVGLGAWSALFVWVYGWLVTSDWLGGSELPDEYRVNLLLEWFPISESLFIGVAFLVPFLTVLLVCVLGKALGIDPEEKAWRSLVWGGRFGLVRAVVALGLMVVLMSLAPTPGDDWLGLFLVVIVLLAPLSILRGSVMSSGRAKGWWKPTWPGWAPLLSAGFLLGFMWATFELLIAIPESVLIVTPDSVRAWLFGLAVVWFLALFWVLPSALAAVLVFQLGPAEALASTRRLTWRALGPLVSLNAWLVFLMVMFAIPARLLWFFRVEHLVLIGLWLSESEVLPPMAFKVLATLTSFAARYSLVVLLPVIWLSFPFVLGRLVWLIGGTADGRGEGSA